MKKKIVPLSVFIPHPCNEPWNNMLPSGEGRHCGKCDKIIHDFSQMSDDELFRFFKTHQGNNCGRFHTAQLKRDILPQPISKSFFTTIHKIAAAIITIISLKALPATATKKAVVEIIQSTNEEKNENQPLTDTTIVSGIVKDINGLPLQGAKVSFGSIQSTITDIDGKFSFTIDSKNVVSENLTFSFDSLINVVRNYHVAMGNATYEVMLYKESGVHYHMMGVPVPHESNFLDLPSISFKPKSVTLTSEAKALLSVVANKMKSNPMATISVESYPQASKKSQDISYKRNDAIKAFLVEIFGISSDRIATNCNLEGGDMETVDIKHNNY